MEDYTGVTLGLVKHYSFSIPLSVLYHIMKYAIQSLYLKVSVRSSVRVSTSYNSFFNNAWYDKGGDNNGGNGEDEKVVAEMQKEDTVDNN